MDKNNDIQINKVDKWCAGVADESLWQAKKSVDIFLCCYSPMLSIEALDAVRTIYVALDEALDRFNELEARHQKDTGLISEYEEENKKLKGYLDIKKDECDDLISRVIRQDIEYAKLETENDDKDDALKKMIKEIVELEGEKIELEVKLAQSDELRYRNAKYAWAIKTILKKATYSPSHVGEELRFMARKSTTPKDVFERWEGIADELLGEHSKLVDKIEWLEKKNEKLSSQVSGLKEENDKLRVLTNWGEIKWVLGEDDI